MLYRGYQSQSDLLLPMQAMARVGQAMLGFGAALPCGEASRRTAAALELFARFRMTHQRPDYGISSVTIDGVDVEVVEEEFARTPFCTLLRFRKTQAARQPKVLVVAPLSGHFSTLLRGTVQTLLADHDVYLTDWHNARDVPLSAGPLHFEDHIDHIIGFLEKIGPSTHVLAVCQPCVQVLAAAAVMSAEDHPFQPRSMTLMAGPIDVRINPTTVNELANEHPIEWFEDNLIARTPWRYAGAGRRVYPGVVQLNAFMAMNMGRHLKAHRALYAHLAAGEVEQAQQIKSFYDEYFAVLDLPAEFYLETVSMVFQEALLARGLLTYRGERVDPSRIRHTALLTVEGERDDICAVGQTAAAHDLCTSLRPYMRRHHLQPGAGHYGVFSGRRWETQVYPIVSNFILAAS